MAEQKPCRDLIYLLMVYCILFVKADADYKAEVFSGREGEAVVNPILFHIYVYKKW